MATKFLAEALGTFAIILFGCGAMAEHLSPSTISMVFGVTVAVMIYALGHLSGAHFNPAVTLGFASVGRIPWRRVPIYWLAQLAGAFLAVGCLRWWVPGATTWGAVSTHLSDGATFGLETLLTFLLMLVIISVATDPRVPGSMRGLSIGGMVLIGSWFGGSLTGAAMNPARYLAPGVVEGKLSFAAGYCSAAFLGAVLAALLYEKILKGDLVPNTHKS